MTDELAAQKCWSLKALLPATRRLELDGIVVALEQAVCELEASRDRLWTRMKEAESGRILGVVHRIRTLVSRPDTCMGLWYDEGTQNQDALAFRGRIEKLLTIVRNRTLFFVLWCKTPEDEGATRPLAFSGDSRFTWAGQRRWLVP